MDFTPLEKNMDIISALDDEPNDVGGLTATELKAKFDEGGNAIKDYLNNTMIPEVKVALGDKAGKDELQGLVLGQIPDGTITEDKLSEELKEQIGSMAPAADVFTKTETLSPETAALYGLTWKKLTVDLSTVIEGDTVLLPEGGGMAEFLVAKLDYESGLNESGRILMIRKGYFGPRAWHNAQGNHYAMSYVDTYLNETYKSTFPESIQTAMGTTKFYYTPGADNNIITTLERAIFLLSGTEFGLSNPNLNVEGSVIENLPPISILNSAALWTRSPNISIGTDAFLRWSNGTANSYTITGAANYMPAFTLPNTFKKTYYYRNGQVEETSQPTDIVPDDVLKKAFLPVGTIMWYSAKTAPSGFLICDGSLISRTNYASLFAVIGTAFGSGDGVTTFKLPDMRATFVRGAGSLDGYSATFGQKQEATNMPSTRPSNGFLSMNNTDKTITGNVSGGFANATQTRNNENMYVRPYNIALTPIIKY